MQRAVDLLSRHLQGRQSGTMKHEGNSPSPSRKRLRRPSPETPSLEVEEGRTMPSVTLEDAQTRLPELIDSLNPGEELVITRNAQPVAKLVGQGGEKPQPVFGRGRGKVIIVAEDDEHLQDFEDYMP